MSRLRTALLMAATAVLAGATVAAQDPCPSTPAGSVIPSVGPVASGIVVAAPGTIVFGTGTSGVQITDQVTTLHAEPTQYMLAMLSEPAGATVLSMQLLEEDESGLEISRGAQQWPVDPTWTQLGPGPFDASEIPAGSYVIRIYRDATLLAQGSFDVAP